MTDYDDMQRATRREWAVAKFVVIGGLIIASAVAGYLGWQHYKEVAAEQLIASPQYQEQQFQKARQENQIRVAGQLVCAMQLAQAKQLGIVPKYAQVISKMPYVTKTRGEYSCDVASQVSRYRITADLVCRQIVNPKCTKVVSVQMDDGTVLYKAK